MRAAIAPGDLRQLRDMRRYSSSHSLLRRRWQKRDLSARHYVYVWADGVYLQARMEPQAECMLVLRGATPEGKKEHVAPLIITLSTCSASCKC